MHEEGGVVAGAAGGAGAGAAGGGGGDDERSMTDSMKMFRWGMQRGKPAKGEVGVVPEWFYKGNGTMLRANNEAIVMPTHAEDGGEEAEVAGVYVIDQTGRPIRVGMAQGNEFSDHVFEKKNYLNLAGSKLRECAIRPELVINPDFSNVPGHVRIMRPMDGEDGGATGGGEGDYLVEGGVHGGERDAVIRWQISSIIILSLMCIGGRATCIFISLGHARCHLVKGFGCRTGMSCRCSSRGLGGRCGTRCAWRGGGGRCEMVSVVPLV